MSENIRLTQYSRGAGCGCKIAPAQLEAILKTESRELPFPGLLVGNESRDDAAVLDLGNGTGLISTTDFFMPILDDAYDFGRVAAANAISDVYAMGGKPVLALAILGWPVDKLPTDLARQVLEGGRAICREAGIPLAGGHSIDSPEPIFGLSVNGIVALDRLKRNDQARAGDLLYLTKPLGAGILATAMKRGQLQEEHIPAWVDSLTRLNRVGLEMGAIPGVHAMTDVTGFGLLGHLLEITGGSGLAAEVSWSAIPRLPGVEYYIAKGINPDATFRNWNACSARVKFGEGVPMMEAFSLLPDPQTNGGLLVCVDPASRGEVESALQAAGLEGFAQPIGRIVAKGEPEVNVLNDLTFN